MKIKGSIKLEITGTEAEREEIDNFVNGIKADPGLSMCKITVDKIMKGREVTVRPRTKNGRKSHAVATETAPS